MPGESDRITYPDGGSKLPHSTWAANVLSMTLLHPPLNGDRGKQVSTRNKELLMVSLNDAQQAAVTADDGPALVLAGAGTGKTRVIIERMAWLVDERGIDPRHLLALTFTNKAADEMRRRLSERLGAGRVGSWLGTFHSFALYILRREMDRLGRPKAFTIFDDSDQLSLMKRLIKDLPSRFEKVSPRDALTWCSQQKQQLKEPDPSEETKDAEEESYRELWRRYHDALLRSSAVDFDDMLVLLVRLLEEHEDVCQKYDHRYRYVLVDEYQDTNHAQYRIARSLTKRHGNLFVVGDEDQSIYSWRGADINNILDFADDFPQAAVCRLEQNYRSTQPILAAANALVSNNVNRLGKTLWSAIKKGEPVRFFLGEDGEEEASFVVKDMVKREVDPRSTAVLFRTNAQARQMEEALRKSNLPYVVVGGIKFYSRAEVKDILCYLRLLVNPKDDESLRRVLNVPPRGIGGVTLQRIEEYARQHNSPMLQVLRDIESDETLAPRARRAGQEFVHIVDDLAIEARTASVEEIAETLLERTEYRTHVERSDEKQARARIEIVNEFVAACRQYDEGGGTGLADFLQDLALTTDVDGWDPEAPAVSLMTCHAAKGLEFDYVYLVGLEEGLLPFGGEFDSGQDVEEERRLCYVAMTRARKGLTLTAASSRVVYGKTHNGRMLSRFLEEIGPERLERVRLGGPKPKKKPAPAAAVDTKGLKTGTRVRHGRFGQGTVMFTSGSGEHMKARVRFDTGRTAMLALKHAPLEILEGKRR